MGSIRSVFVKVNSNLSYRAKFVRDPVGTLRKEGYTLTAKNQKELRRLIRILKADLTELGELPSGYDDLIDKVQGKHVARKPSESGPLII